jgi:superfamily II DNA or RNA helicase
MRTLEHRDYQHRIIDKTLGSYRKGATNVLIESPAGSGKTVMALSAMKKLVSDAPDLVGKKSQDITFGWVAMRRNLLAQAKEENDEMIGCPNIKYISMFDSNPPPVDILVVDEAQHDAANSCHHIHNICNPKLVLGLSATPFRTDRMKLSFDVVIKDAGYHRLIQDGWLSQFNQWMLSEYNVGNVTSAYLKDRAKWGKTLIYFLTIAECEQAAAILKAGGVRCDVVTGYTDRFAQIDEFEADNLDVLLNVYVLSEGFDFPRLRSVFVRDSQKGPVIQMAGRVLRKHPDIPIANIVQSADTRWPFVRTAKPHAQFITVGDEWRSLGTNELVDIMQKRMLRKIIQTDTRLPAFITRCNKNRIPFSDEHNFIGSGVHKMTRSNNGLDTLLQEDTHDFDS